MDEQGTQDATHKARPARIEGKPTGVDRVQAIANAVNREIAQRDAEPNWPARMSAPMATHEIRIDPHTRCISLRMQPMCRHRQALDIAVVSRQSSVVECWYSFSSNTSIASSASRCASLLRNRLSFSAVRWMLSLRPCL